MNFPAKFLKKQHLNSHFKGFKIDVSKVKLKVFLYYLRNFSKELCKVVTQKNWPI